MPRYAFAIAFACIFGACEFENYGSGKSDTETDKIITITHITDEDRTSYNNEPRDQQNITVDQSRDQSCDQTCEHVTLTLDRAPSCKYLCNNKTFDWMTQTLVSEIARLHDVIDEKQRHIEDLKQDAARQRETYDMHMKRSQDSQTTDTAQRQAQKYAAFQPHDCADIQDLGHRYNGIYKIYPLQSYYGSDEQDATKEKGVSVFCDMSSADGGWTVLQRRVNRAQLFNKTWHEYKQGFGHLATNFWIGNDLLHVLTNQREYVLRVDMIHNNGTRFYAQYNRFHVASEQDNYRLHIAKYYGNAGDAFAAHNDKEFSTIDNDHDLSQSGNCAVLFGGGGWWYDRCYDSNLNGVYTNEYGKDGIVWYQLDFDHTPLKYVDMKIRPKQFRHNIYTEDVVEEDTCE